MVSRVWLRFWRKSRPMGGEGRARCPSRPVFFGHAGGLSGYLCFAWHEPEHDITIVYFGSSNLVDALHWRRNFEFEHLLEKALFELAVEQTDQDG
jgi:hypothetical protein